MRSLIAVGFVVYLFFVARNFPADVAVSWFVPDTATVYGVEGRVWEGSATAIDPGIAPGLQFGATRWTVSPLWLLTLRASGTFSTQLGENSRINTAFSKPFFGQKLKLSETQGILDLTALPAALRPSQVSGKVGMTFDSLTLDALWPVNATGSVDLVDLQLSRPTSAKLGSFEVLFDGGDGETLVGQVADTDSDISLEGTLTLAADRSYLFDGTALAGAGADRNVADALQFLGAVNSEGRVELRFDGTVD